MIMDKLEKVEKLREKTGVSYEDAKNALEACDYDLLDAIIYLEKLDKVKAPEVESFTTGAEQQTSTEFEQAQRTYTNDCNKVTFGQMMDRFLKWFCECRYHFEGIGDINVNLNSACDKMADSVDNLKSDVNNK